MDLLTVIIVIVFVGVALCLINRYVPMDGKIKTILNWAVVIVLVVWLLKIFGIFAHLSSVTI